MSWEGYSLLLLRACGVSPPMLVQILHQYAGRFPNTEAESTAMEVTLRRMGHILENSPMNVGSRVRPPTGDSSWTPRINQ